ncbi:MAG: FHA domain-containing protein [Sporomusaceae bacterium]|nr:FHA domain-containing protein [Sporomusaceae bacterium]
MVNFVKQLETQFEKYLDGLTKKEKIKRRPKNSGSNAQAAGAVKEPPAVAEETKVFEKVGTKYARPAKESVPTARISIIDGEDTGVKTEIGEARVNIGRRPSNEMVLNDKSSSRLHAYIVREGAFHVIYDAQSLNGTFVNDELAEKKVLSGGDKIKIGDTVILYETC